MSSIQLEIAAGKQPNGLIRAPGTALHRQVFVILRDQIIRGVYEIGSSLSTEEELCREFKVSRITIRRALGDLEAAGYVEKRTARGTFVIYRQSVERESATLSYLEWVGSNIVGTRKELLSVSSESPPRDIARQLDIIEGQKAMKSMRLHSTKLPVLLTESWIRQELGSQISESQLRDRPLSELLIEKGISFGKVVQELTAVMATPAIAEVLRIELGTAIVKTMRLIYDKKRRPVQHLTVYFSPERSRLLMEISIGAVNTLGTGAIFHDIDQEGD